MCVSGGGGNHDLGQGVKERRVIVDRRGASHLDSNISTRLGSFVVEVIQHLYVVSHKPDRTDDHGSKAVVALAPKIVTDIRPQPGVMRATATALKYKRPSPAGRDDRPPAPPTRSAQPHIVTRSSSSQECCAP